jgi:hypothetical protein
MIPVLWNENFSHEYFFFNFPYSQSIQELKLPVYKLRHHTKRHGSPTDADVVVVLVVLVAWG